MTPITVVRNDASLSPLSASDAAKAVEAVLADVLVRLQRKVSAKAA